MDAEAEAELAGWLTEAFETGNALAPLPPSHQPEDVAQGERVAAAVLARLGMPACGVRTAPAPDGATIAGPMLEGRLLPAAAPVALATLRHPGASVAVVAVLAEALAPGDAAAPVVRALHPAVDIAAGRLREPHATPALMAADLAGLGLVVVGRGVSPGDALPDTMAVTLAPAGRRPRPAEVAIGAALMNAARAAPRFGGLPAGALLVVTGLGGMRTPVARETLAAAIGPLGRVRARFA